MASFITSLGFLYSASNKIIRNKTSVESVKLGETSDLSKRLSWKFSTPCKIGLRWIINFMNPLIFVRKA